MDATSAAVITRGACPHDCPDTCALRVTVEAGRVVRVQGDADHPPTHGALCTKVSRYAERTYHPERVLHPLRRTGPKGSGRFERIGWDAALAEAAQRLGTIAAREPQAVLPYSYAGTMGPVQGEAMAARVFHRMGASLLDRTICSSAGGEALLATYGAKVGMHLEHFAESRLIVIWGSNSIASNLHFWTFAQQAKRAGAKLWCIDPRRTETAEKCHRHLALLPGTDGALALAVMHELITNRWLDEAYIASHVQGFDALRERALGWPAERAAAECGVAVGDIRELARDYGRTQPAAIRLNYGMQRVAGGGSAVRLIALLPCLTGAWRHRAGGLLLSSSGWFDDDDEQLARCAVKGIDFDELRAAGWIRLPLPEAPFAHGGFRTASGKAQVDAPGLGVVDYVPPREAAGTPLAQRYPLAMISPPARHFLNSSFVNVRSLRSIEGEPLLEMHAADAAARGIVDGAMVEVFNDRGTYHCRADVSLRARPGVVNALGVWWRKFGARGTNVNELTSQRLTDIGRAPTFYDCRVEVRPA